MFEWVEDCANKTHAGAPADASPRGGDCARRVAKGGAWYYEAEFARPSARMSFPKGSRLNVIGFRVAPPWSSCASLATKHGVSPFRSRKLSPRQARLGDETYHPRRAARRAWVEAVPLLP